MIKLTSLLLINCALIASSVARFQFDTEGANEILVFAKDHAKLSNPVVLNTTEDTILESPVNVEPKVKNKVESIISPDQWPPQIYKPIKEGIPKQNPVEVLIPSSISVKPPTYFTNTIKYSDFTIPDYSVGADQRVEYYYGTYGSLRIFMKKAIPGFENILYQEAQVMQAISDKAAFPQLIHYDGRRLIMNVLCSTWAQYTSVQFQSGGMNLEDAYNMMHQVLDALKELHLEGYVHRDISANNIAFGCYYYKDVPEMKAPFKLSETSKFYIHEFGATENVKEPNLNKFDFFAGSYDFVSNATLHNEEPMFVQDAESLGYVLIYGLNGGLLTWNSMNSFDIDENIALKTALNLDENLARMRGNEKIIAKAKRDIAKYFSLIKEHTLNRPKELLDYEALKACFDINDYPSLN